MSQQKNSIEWAQDESTPNIIFFIHNGTIVGLKALTSLAHPQRNNVQGKINSCVQFDTGTSAPAETNIAVFVVTGARGYPTWGDLELLYDRVFVSGARPTKIIGIIHPALQSAVDPKYLIDQTFVIDPTNSPFMQKHAGLNGLPKKLVIQYLVYKQEEWEKQSMVWVGKTSDFARRFAQHMF
eukprot:TRINITY_DN68792_c0_g1_i1.p1 TRINITY_DN68792_c0_g1~~TRINITY_DN68792_c0_g1_i1.p1  ORF type:complete len:182 (+),score=30.96 TRINITY_DN68792_c0_g1_i1:93-638(+)